MGKLQEHVEVDLPIKQVHDAGVCGARPPHCRVTSNKKKGYFKGTSTDKIITFL